jgi:hypothetical protein
MTTRTSSRTVTFRNAFLLPGMDRAHAPGQFEVQIIEEPIDVSWEAYHRTLTIMLTSGGLTEAVSVSQAHLDEALAADGKPTRVPEH